MSSSILTALAQPISLPSLSHPGSGCHACHLLPITMPIPIVELALEYPWTSVMCHPPGVSLERVGCERVFCHQVSSSARSLGG